MNLFRQISGLFSGLATASDFEGREIAGELSLGETRAVEVDGIEQRSAQAWGELFGIAGGSGAGSQVLADPYNLSPWVGSAIRHITRPIAQVPLKFYDTAADGSEIERNDPELAAFWNRPAKGMSRFARLSRYDTIEATVGWLCLAGEFFWLLDDTWNNPGTRNKSPMIIARPDRMTPIHDGGELLGWRFLDGSRKTFLLTPDQVVGSNFWNPTDDWRGSAPMRAAELAAAADYAAAKMWKALSEKNGDLGETVIAPNGVTTEQQQQIVLAMKRKLAAAKRGQSESRFLIGDVKTEKSEIQSPDAAAVTQRLQNRHEVYMVFGVPPSFCEVVASYSIGSASDRYKLMEETCMPIGSKIAEAVETVSQRFNGKPVGARFYFDSHSTMQQVRQERIAAGTKMHERGIPWDVISDQLDLKLPQFPGSEKAWLPFNLRAIDENAAAPAKPAATAEVPGAEPVKLGIKACEELEVLLRGCPAHPTRRGGETRKNLTDLAARMDLEKRSQLWTARMQTRAPFVKRMRVIFDKALFDARRETLANLAAAESGEKMIRSGAFDFLFDLGKFLEAIVEPIFQLSSGAYRAAGEELVKDDLGLDSPFIGADPAGLAWLQDRKNFIQDAGTEVWSEIRNQLDQGLDAGESYAKLGERVRAAFNGISKERGLRIAMTETGIAFESGRNDAMVENGVEGKEWLHSGLSEDARPAHIALDGTVVGIHEPFIVNGVEMMFPCDPNGTPAEIIRCHCIHGPADKPEPPDIEGNNPDLGIPF